MQSYLFVGGTHDGLDIPVEDGRDEARIRVSAVSSEVYIRDTLAVGDMAIVIFRYKSLPPAQALDRFASHYKAWRSNRSRDRRRSDDGDSREVRPHDEIAPAKVSEFTKEQAGYIRAYLAQVRERAKPDRKELQECHQSEWKGETLWSEYGISGIDAQTAVWWYQRRHKPGSRVWSPTTILRALVKASERDYVEPERIPVSDIALKSTNSDRAQARFLFIRKHGVAAFHQKVYPILRRRRGGVEALFQEPATPETRAYVAILEEIARK